MIAGNLAFAAVFALVSVFWLLVFARYSRNLKAATLWAVFAAGLVSGPLAGLVSQFVESFLLPALTTTSSYASRGAVFDWPAFILYFLIVGPVEEAAKFLAVFAVALRRPDFQTASDGMVLAIAAGLGFACGENVLYMLAFGVEQTLPRLILGNLGHAAFAIFWGYALGAVLHENAGSELLVVGLGIAAVVHGAYNYLLGYNVIGATLAFALSAALYRFMFVFLRGESQRR